MVERRIHTMASHHGHNTANHGQTWLAMKNRGTMVNLIAGRVYDHEQNASAILKVIALLFIHIFH